MSKISHMGKFWTAAKCILNQRLNNSYGDQCLVHLKMRSFIKARQLQCSILRKLLYILHVNQVPLCTSGFRIPNYLHGLSISIQRQVYSPSNDVVLMKILTILSANGTNSKDFSTNNQKNINCTSTIKSEIWIVPIQILKATSTTYTGFVECMGFCGEVPF